MYLNLGRMTKSITVVWDDKIISHRWNFSFLLLKKYDKASIPLLT